MLVKFGKNYPTIGDMLVKEYHLMKHHPSIGDMLVKTCPFIKHHPTIGDIIFNRYFFRCCFFKSKKGHLPTPGESSRIIQNGRRYERWNMNEYIYIRYIDSESSLRYLKMECVQPDPEPPRHQTTAS